MNCSTWNRIILFFAPIVPRGTIPNYSGYTRQFVIAFGAQVTRSARDFFHDSAKLKQAYLCSRCTKNS